MCEFPRAGSHLDSIRDLLAAHLPHSPRDFIRGISAQDDRKTYADELTRSIAEEDDLRIAVPLDGGDLVGVFAERLPWDSEFFGYGIARLNGVFPLSQPLYRPTEDYRLALVRLLGLAREKSIRYLFAGVDPRDLALLRALGECGFSLIETRGYFHMPLSGYSHGERFPVRVAHEGDVERLSDTAAEMVNPFDRFHADPFIATDDADRLMRRWVKASIGDGFADVVIVPDDEAPTAFCTVKYHREHWNRWGLKLAQPVLSAVSRQYRGWYKKLISEVNYHLGEIGAEHSYLVTQVTNIAVTWTWESLGYRFGKAEHIFRVVL